MTPRLSFAAAALATTFATVLGVVLSLPGVRGESATPAGLPEPASNPIPTPAMPPRNTKPTTPPRRLDLIACTQDRRTVSLAVYATGDFNSRSINSIAQQAFADTARTMAVRDLVGGSGFQRFIDTIQSATQPHHNGQTVHMVVLGPPAVGGICIPAPR